MSKTNTSSQSPRVFIPAKGQELEAIVWLTGTGLPLPIPPGRVFSDSGVETPPCLWMPEVP